MVAKKYALTPKAILKELDKIAPDIEITTVWEEDPYFVWDGDGPDPAEEGYVAHNVTVKAVSLVEDYPAEGEAHLGGVYAKPGEADPEISGYFYDMLTEALELYYIQLTGESPRRERRSFKDWDPRHPELPEEAGLDAEATEAIQFVKRSIDERYRRQQRRSG